MAHVYLATYQSEYTMLFFKYCGIWSCLITQYQSIIVFGHGVMIQCHGNTVFLDMYHGNIGIF